MPPSPRVLPSRLHAATLDVASAPVTGQTATKPAADLLASGRAAQLWLSVGVLVDLSHHCVAANGFLLPVML